MTRRNSRGAADRLGSAGARPPEARIATGLLCGAVLAWSLVPAAALAGETAGAAACSALVNRPIGPHAKIISAHEVARSASPESPIAGGTALPPAGRWELPAYCEVSAVITPAAGS